MANVQRTIRKIVRSKITLIILVIMVTISMVSFFSWKGDPNSSSNPLLPDFYAASISKISLTKPGQEPQVVEKKNNSWVISSANDLPADSAKVLNILRVLEEAEIREVLVFNPADKDKYGLGSTATRLELYSGSDKLNDLWLGSQAESFSTSYARLEAENSVFLTSVNLNYLISQDDFLDRQALDLKISELSEIIWKNKVQSISMTRENQDWVISGKKISAQSLGELLKNLELVKATDIAWQQASTIVNYDWQIEFKSGNSSQKISIRKLNQDKAVLVKDGDKRLFIIASSNYDLFLFPIKIFGLIK